MDGTIILVKENNKDFTSVTQKYESLEELQYLSSRSSSLLTCEVQA